MKAYTTATAADSVAVNQPKMTPPTMMMQVIRPSRASFVAIQISLGESIRPLG